MRGAGFIRAAIATAGLAMAQPAGAQSGPVFLQCAYDWSNGGHDDKVFAISGDQLLVWQTGLGAFVSACDPRDAFSAAGDTCVATVGTYRLSIQSRSSVSSLNVGIDRTTGQFSALFPASGLSAKGTCRRGSDPRTAPRAF